MHVWDSLLDALGWLLALFYGVIPNYGVAIVLLTVTIRLLLFPLTAKQARSMAAMQRVQPEIKKIQAKYKHDRQKLNEELMAFYKEHQINPLAGCLPLVAQLPVFFALFNVLRNTTSHVPVSSDLYTAFCPPRQITAGKCEPLGLSFLGMDLSKAAPSADGFVDALPYLVLIGLVIVSGYLQSRQMTSLQQGRANPQAQMMGRIMPVFFGVISYSLPSGVVVYFLTSNLWQIGQQAVVFGKMGVGAPAGATKGKDTTGKGAAPPGQKAPKDVQAPIVEVEARDAGGDVGGDVGGDEPSQPEAASHAARGNGSASKVPARTRSNQSRKRKKRKRRR
jgi:YidC/Oxa1 family membrane protein insertase